MYTYVSVETEKQPQNTLNLSQFLLESSRSLLFFDCLTLVMETLRFCESPISVYQLTRRNVTDDFYLSQHLLRALIMTIITLQDRISKAVRVQHTIC
jgi:hypothetical protein